MGAFTSLGEKVWPVTPDWTDGVQESLAWLSDVMHASASAVSQHRGLRVGPRRSFGFEVLAEGQERRVADMLLAGYSGTWLLPIWPDVQWLTVAPEPASAELPCATFGFDFVVGGKALLYRSVNDWDVVEIDSIEADRLVLSDPVPSFTPGMRLYPLRRARAAQGAKEVLGSDTISRRQIIFDIIEPCDWPALEDLTSYLGHPVLEVRPDESEDPAVGYTRLLQTVDTETSMPLEHDLPGLALRTQQSHWKLWGRAEHTWFRSLLYTMQGRRVPMWVPSFASDVKPAATVAGGSTSMSVEWCGYTLFGKDKHNRKDVRIELMDGSVLYRRIANAVEAGATETITLSAALSGSAIAADSIRLVSFMALSTLASDAIDIEHAADQDGLATATTGWQAVVPDV